MYQSPLKADTVHGAVYRTAEGSSGLRQVLVAQPQPSFNPQNLHFARAAWSFIFELITNFVI